MNALLLERIGALLGSLSHELRLLDPLGHSLIPSDATEYYLPLKPRTCCAWPKALSIR